MLKEKRKRKIAMGRNLKKKKLKKG